MKKSLLSFVMVVLCATLICFLIMILIPIIRDKVAHNNNEESFDNLSDSNGRTNSPAYPIEHLRVIFSGCARNCGTHLQSSLRNIDMYSKLFREAHVVILENGSTDTTKKQLQDRETANTNTHVLYHEELTNEPVRTIRLAAARNHIVEYIRSTDTLHSCDLLIMMDLDDIGAYRIDDKSLAEAVRFLMSRQDVSAVFANQLGYYYDMWALRHHQKCPDDCWLEVFSRACSESSVTNIQQIPDSVITDAFNQTLQRRWFALPPTDEAMEVESAFGGFGVYSLDHVMSNKRKYVGEQHRVVHTQSRSYTIQYEKCEHVDFHYGLRELGTRLYVLPFLINGHYDHTFPVAPVSTGGKCSTDMVIRVHSDGV